MATTAHLHDRAEAEDRALCVAHLRANVEDALQPGPPDVAARVRRMREIIDHLGLAAARRRHEQLRDGLERSRAA